MSNPQANHRFVSRLFRPAGLVTAAACAALLAVAAPASADLLAEWDFTTDVSASTLTGITALDAAKGAGITLANGSGRSGGGQNLFVRSNTAFNGPVVTNGNRLDMNDEQSVVDADDYFQFTVGPEAGYTMNLESVTFDYFAQDVDENKGPVSFFKSFLRSSVDGYSTTLESAVVTDVAGSTDADTGNSITINVQELLDSSFTGLTDDVMFRVYFHDSVDAGSDGLIQRIDNFQVNGTVAIPTPATATLLGLAGTGIFMRRRR